VTVALNNALAIAARSVSTSYGDVLTADELAQMLRSGVVPECYQAHLMYLLDETPLPVVLQAVSEAATVDAPAEKIMEDLRVWAKQWKVSRSVEQGILLPKRLI
jgi:hypothetical protein